MGVLAVLPVWTRAAVAAHDVHQTALTCHADPIDREVCIEVAGVFGTARACFVDLDRCVIGELVVPERCCWLGEECAGHDAAPVIAVAARVVPQRRQ